jgi:competence protein ComEC
MTLPDSRLRRRGYALTLALAGWVLGTALQLQQPHLWPRPVYAALGLAGLACALLGWRWRTGKIGLLAWLLAGAATALAATGWRASVLLAESIQPALEGRDLLLTGIVQRMPQHTDAGWRFVFDVEQASQNRLAVSVPPRLLLTWQEWDDNAPVLDEEAAAPPRQSPPLADLHVGERWRFSVRLKAAHGNLNPHGYDYELWLWEQGIRATGYVRAGPHDAPPSRLSAGGWSVDRWRQSVRDRIVGAAASRDAQARRMAGIIAALVAGDQGALARAAWDTFRAAGAAHLIIISGLHITMFAWLAAALVGGLWRRSARWSLPAWCNPCLLLPAPAAAAIGGVLRAGGYALFSGWGVPAQRTILMLATVSLLKLAGLRWPWWLNWLLACAVVLAADPWALQQAGFWLSFVAVGILFATDSGAGERRGLLGYFPGLLRDQSVVTLALTPLSVILFGQLSVIGLLANLLAIPWVTLVVTPVALLGIIWPPLWQAAAWLLAPLVLLLQWLISWPWASVTMPAAPLALGVAAVAGGVLLALRWPWPLRLAGLPLLLPLLLWQPARPAPGQFELLAADIGQGNAVIVHTATHTLVYDTGPRYSLESDAGDRVLLPLLHAFGERVDLLVLSHRDADHTGGARSLLTMQPQARLLSSIEPQHELQRLRPATRCEAGQHWAWDGVGFSILQPAAHDYEVARKTNALSCVLRVAAGDTVALLVGDIEAPQERTLVDGQPAALRAQVLLVPHHGSRTSSSPAFLDAVAPRWALVQAGYRNRFGHPAPAVMARYAERGIAVADSPHCGAMHWSSAAPETLQCQRALDLRYWHHRAP